ncbi:MAG TPA: hybrid sensor histidine kinase/response regulator [Vicinamibacteria bacterium]|nr:hybrid sensor histidine kinase/response regulator [Vicinamibacteria bacterium]
MPEGALASPPDPREENALTAGGAVLIIDDDEAVRGMTAELVGLAGYTTLVAENGSAGLRLAAAAKPDAVLLDVNMPGIDGLEVCRRLRADPATSEIPIILITALGDPESRLAGLEAGADDFMAKPYDELELRTRLKNIFRLNRYRRLQAERARFDWVVESSDDGYLILDGEGAVLHANSRAQVFLGSVQGRFPEILGADYLREPEAAWRSWPAPSESGAARFVVRPETPTARAFWLEVESLEAPDATRVVRLRDVTARMALHRDVRSFGALVSHKLRTPLAALLGSLQFLADSLSELSPEAAREMAGTALAAARGLAADADRVLGALSRIGGTGPLASELPELVRATAAQLEIATVSLRAEELPACRLALPTPTVEWMLREVLENAKKFHPRQAPSLEVALRPDEGRMALSVKDDGVRPSPEQIARAFVPYFQGDKDFTGQVPGLGLGLSAVASRLWEAGGRCRMRAREDKPGVVVDLLLPIAHDCEDQP